MIKHAFVFVKLMLGVIVLAAQADHCHYSTSLTEKRVYGKNLWNATNSPSNQIPAFADTVFIKEHRNFTACPAPFIQLTIVLNLRSLIRQDNNNSGDQSLKLSAYYWIEGGEVKRIEHNGEWSSPSDFRSTSVTIRQNGIPKPPVNKALYVMVVCDETHVSNFDNGQVNHYRVLLEGGSVVWEPELH